MRQVTKIQENELWLDAPLPLAMDAEKNRWTITKLNSGRWIQNVGVENLRIVSTFDPANPMDEEHAWQGITFHNVRDGWARRIVCQHLVSSTVSITPTRAVASRWKTANASLRSGKSAAIVDTASTMLANRS